MAADAAPLTIPALLVRGWAERTARPAIHFRREGQTLSRTWAELAEQAGRLAVALRRLGLEPGDRVAQIAENSYEWVLTDLGILLARGVHVPIHPSLAAEQIAYQVEHCGAKLAIVAGRELADKLAAHKGLVASGVQLLVLNDWPRSARHSLRPRPIPPLMAEIDAADANAIREQAAQETNSSDLATIMYTSGTTGVPRGVMLTHGNLASNAIATSETFDSGVDELRLTFLPLTHIYARTCDMYTWLYRGTELALAETRETILADCAHFRPMLLNGVPYFYNKLHQRLAAAGKDHEPGILGGLLGGRIRFCFSGGAALPPHVAHFFAEQGVPLLEGYGLTESSPVITATRLGAAKIGAVGQPIRDVEVRIADDGEILTRGPHVMRGYWRDDDATREAIRDGWLHTGDLGQLDDQGYLSITGRKKELLVTATGKNIAPAHLESLLSASPLVAQVMVLGEGRNYLAALVVPEAERLRSEMSSRKIRVFSRRGALRHARVVELYREEFSRLLSGVSQHEQIGRILLLDRGFTIDSGELTAKGSLRRSVIAANFAAEIAELYAGEPVRST